MFCKNQSSKLTRCIAVGFLSLGFVTPGLSATITVTTPRDAPAPPGVCSLRHALENANAGSTIHAECAASGAYGADTINFEASVFPPGSMTKSVLSGELTSH